jgi:Leucine-rich repeat (LRR) protein
MVGKMAEKSRVVEYKGLSLVESEVEALRLIEEETKRSIDLVDVIAESKYNEIKVVIKDNHILSFSSIGFCFTTEAVKDFCKLESLRLRWNELSTIPDYITDMKWLKMLDLRFNKISIIPDSIKKLTALEELNLDNNLITSLPDSILNFTALKRFDIAHLLIKKPFQKILAFLEGIQERGGVVYSNSIRNMNAVLTYNEEYDHKYRINTQSGYNFVAIYPFFGQFQLIAQVERKSGRQEMRIEYLNSDGDVVDGKIITCIHTAVTTTTLDELESIPPDVPKEDYFLNGVSTEHLPQIKLTPEEHFFALSSWVQGIAETGEEFIRNLEMLQPYPTFFRIIKDLIQFILLYDTRFIQQYLSRVEKECQMNGKPHIPSLIASLKVLEQLNPEESPEIIKMLLSMNFPLEVYVNILRYDVMKENFEQDPRYEEAIFNYPNMVLSADPEAAKYSRFVELFSNKSFYIRYGLVNNPAALQFPEYKLLFKCEDLRTALLESKYAAQFPEFQDITRKD